MILCGVHQRDPCGLFLSPWPCRWPGLRVAARTVDFTGWPPDLAAFFLGDAIAPGPLHALQGAIERQLDSVRLCLDRANSTVGPRAGTPEHACRDAHGLQEAKMGVPDSKTDIILGSAFGIGECCTSCREARRVVARYGRWRWGQLPNSGSVSSVRCHRQAFANAAGSDSCSACQMRAASSAHSLRGATRNT